MKIKKFIKQNVNNAQNLVINSDGVTQDTFYSNLKKGDLLKIHFFRYEDKRKGGNHFRVSKAVLMLNKYTKKKNNITFNLTGLYKHELVTIRTLVSGPQVVKIERIKAK